MKIYTTPETNFNGYHEHIDSRNEFTRVFDNAENPTSSVAILSPIPICYQTKDGDYDLVELSLDIDKNNYVGSSTQTHDIWLKKRSKGIVALFGKDDKYYGYELPEDCADVHGELHGNTMVYREIYPGIDFYVKNSAEGLDKNFIIKDYWSVRDLSLSIVTHNVEVRWNDVDASFKVYSVEGQELWASRRIAGKDSSTRGHMNEVLGQDYFVEFERISSLKNTIHIRYKKEFLKHATFPVYIDPSVTWTYQFLVGATPRMRLKSYYDLHKTTDPAGDEPLCGQVYDDWGTPGVYHNSYARMVVYYPFDTLGIVSLQYACFRGFVRWRASQWPEKSKTYIRRINFWPNGMLTPGWNNRATSYADPAYTNNSTLTMWNDFEITSIVNEFLLGVPNLGIQLDARPYEGTGQIMGWKRFFRGDEGPDETYWDHRNAVTEAGGGAGKAAHLYLVYENNRAPNKAGKPRIETTNGVIGDAAKIIYPIGTDPDGDLVTIYAKIYVNGNYIGTTPPLSSYAHSAGYLYSNLDTSNRTSYPNGFTYSVSTYLKDNSGAIGLDSDRSDICRIDPTPGYPTNFKMNGTDYFSAQTPNVTFTWIEPAKRTNAYNGITHELPQSYEIGIQNTATNVEIIKSGFSGSTCVLNLSEFSNITPECTFRARIRTVTPYGTRGLWTIYTANAQYISPPKAPSLVNPLMSILPACHFRPIIPIKLGSDPSGTQREVVITSPTLNYKWTTKTHPALFSRVIPKPLGEEHIYFRPDKNLPNGPSILNIEIINAAGAKSVIFKLTVDTSYNFVFNFIKSYNKIEAKNYNDMLNFLRLISAVYGYGGGIAQNVTQNSPITATNISGFQSDLIGLENVVHGSSGVGSDKLLLTPIQSTPISKDSEIMLSSYVLLKNQLENL